MQWNSCAIKHEFHWTRQGTCLATFRCSRLEGLPCETYALNVSFPETGIMESFHSVCTENAVILGKNWISVCRLARILWIGIPKSIGHPKIVGESFLFIIYHYCTKLYLVGRLDANQSVSIEIWYDWRYSNMPKADCLLWCSNTNPNEIPSTTSIAVSEIIIQKWFFCSVSTFNVMKK